MTENDRHDRFAEVLRLTWNMIRAAEHTDDEKQLHQLAGDLVELIVTTWGDANPHNAMESLEGAAIALPFPFAHTVIREATLAWRKRPDYNPEAGGNADHCYLSALAMTENYDLAEHPWADRVATKCVQKDYQHHEMKMRERKVRAMKQAFE